MHCKRFGAQVISRRSESKLIEAFSNPSLRPVMHTNQNQRRIVWFFLVCGLSNQQRKEVWTWVKPKDRVLGGFKQKGHSSAARTRQGNGGNQSGARSLPDSNMTSKAPNIAEENRVPQFVLTIPQRHYDIMGHRARRFSVKNVSFNEIPPSISQDHKIPLGKPLASTVHYFPNPI